MNRAFSKVLVLVILIILAGGGIFAWQYLGVQQSYRNEQYGFEIKYPSSYEITSLGPNEEQQSIEKGEQISGTIPPAFDAVVFKEEGNEKFRIIIYHSPTKTLNSEYGFDGTCGSQFAEENLTNQLIAIDNKEFLERRQTFRDNKIQIDYCFISGSGNLITLRSSNLSSEEVEKTDKLLQETLSNIRFLETGGEKVIEETKTPEEKVVDETANWKTYKNEDYGYELRYPTDWNITVEAPDYYCLSKDSCVGGAERIYSISSIRFGGLRIIVLNNPSMLSTQAWINKYINTKTASSVTETEIGGEKGIRIIFTNGAINNVSYVVKGPVVYSISMSYSGPGEENLKKILDQILSTIRFVEWETYTNKEWGYKISFPSNWKKAEELPQTSQQAWWVSPRETPEKKYIGIVVKENPNNLPTPEFILGKPIACEYISISYLLPRFCKLTEKFEGIQEIIYATDVLPITGPEIVYALTLRIEGGRQRMDYYLSEEEIKPELDILNQMLSTIEFISIEK